MVFDVKGQGATEYLVLLAVVLIIALVSIALLGFFPGLVPDARITQSNSYWQSARPVGVVEHSLNSGTLTMVIRNNDASGTITINKIIVGGQNSSNYTLAPGEQKTITITGLANGTSGTVYDLNVSVNYTTGNGVNNVEYGSKNIVGKYA